MAAYAIPFGCYFARAGSRGYQIDYDRIIGAPDWTNRERFDISATMPANSTREQIGAMMQSLLADRFALKAIEKIARSGSTFSLRRVRMVVQRQDFDHRRLIAGTLSPPCGDHRSLPVVTPWIWILRVRSARTNKTSLHVVKLIRFLPM